MKAWPLPPRSNVVVLEYSRTDVACGIAQRAIDDLQRLIDADPDDPDTVEIHDMMIALLKGKATLRERARRRGR